jgi:hypothetical protein
MITDLVINIVYQLYLGLIGLLPDMPERPAAWDSVLWVIAGLNYLVPFKEFYEFLPVMVGMLGVLASWRLIRLLLPGG